MGWRAFDVSIVMTFVGESSPWAADVECFGDAKLDSSGV